MSEHQNDPNEIHNLPFEPQMGEYAKLSNAHTALEVLHERDIFPQHLWAKHKGLAFRNYFEIRPNKDWDIQYAAFAKKLAGIEDPEQHPEQWVGEIEKLVPHQYNDRFTKAHTLAPYQKRQFQSVLSLLSKSQHLKRTKDSEDILLHAHSANRFDVATFFESPAPFQAARHFPTVPLNQREQWFDLLIHFTMSAQLQPEAEALKRCFNDEHKVARGFKNNEPCRGAGVRYQHGFNFWKKEVFDRSHGLCQPHKLQLRRAMVDEPDWNKSKILHEDLLRCVNARRHTVSLLGHTMRESADKIGKVQDARSPKYWIQTNAWDEFFGKYGPWSREGHHSAADAEKAETEYKAQIAPLTEGFHDMKSSEGHSTLTVANFASTPTTSTNF